MRKNRGYALLTSLAAIFILGILVFSMLGIALGGTHLTGHRRDSQAAFDLADAGFQHAYRCLVENPAYTGQANTPLGAGTFSVVVTPGTASSVHVLSMGSIMGGEGINSTRTISGVVNASSITPLMNYAIVAKGDISFSGGANVTSSPTSGVGDVFSNGNVSMSGGVIINGTLGAGGTISASGSATATGGETQGAAPVTFPTVNTAQMQALAAANGSSTGDVLAPSGVTKTIQGVINGNVTATGSGQIVINGPTFVTGNLVLSGNSYSGNGTIFVQGTVTISGSSGATAPDTSNLAIVDLSSSTNAVVLSGGASVGGFLYVPNGTTVMSGGANVFGGIATDNVNFSGSVNVTRNTGQGSPAGIGTPTIAYWYDETGS